MYALEIRGLAKRYGAVAALTGVDLDADYGEVVGLIGPNGAGKTTTMRALLGLVRADAGTIRYDGIGLVGVARASDVGALVDRPAVYPYLSAIDNLRVAEMALGAAHVLPAFAGAQMITLLGLESVARRPIRTYSTGQRQRLGIALALLGGPRVVVLDEPGNGLDPEGIVFVRRLVRDLASQGRAVVLSSHLLSEVEKVCNRVVMLIRGQVVAQGRPDDLVGGRRDLALRFATANQAQRAAIVLAAAGIGVRPLGERMILPNRGDEGPAIAELLAGDQLFPSELSAITSRLEDVFFEIAGGEQHGSAS